MRANEDQRKIITFLRDQLHSWEGSNDINSPSLEGNIDEELFMNLDVDVLISEAKELRDLTNNLLKFIQKIK